MPNNIALFDMDGTLCDLQGAMIERLNAIAAPNEPKITNIHDPALPKHIKKRIAMIKESRGFWEQLEELKLGFDILREVRKAGYAIHILTKGPSATNAYSAKVAWVHEHIPDAKITIAEDKGMVYGKILVEDHPVFIQHWLAYRPRGIVIMPKNAHNKTFKHPQVIMYNGKNLAQVRKAVRNRLKVREVPIR